MISTYYPWQGNCATIRWGPGLLSVPNKDGRPPCTRPFAQWQHGSARSLATVADACSCHHFLMFVHDYIITRTCSILHKLYLVYEATSFSHVPDWRGLEGTGGQTELDARQEGLEMGVAASLPPASPPPCLPASPPPRLPASPACLPPCLPASLPHTCTSTCIQ